MLLHHEVTGDGPSVLLIHAGVADSRMWAGQVPALVGAGLRVITLDLRGFGRSTPPPGSYSDVADVVGVLDHVGAASVDIVGASYGGLIALRIASAHPDRVRSLVLLAPPVTGVDKQPEIEAFGEREEELAEAGDIEGAAQLNVDTWVGPEASDEARGLVLAMQRRALELQLAQPNMEHEDPDPDLAQITVETLSITGEHDFDFFKRGGDHLAETMPNVRRLHLDWAGHLPALERPIEIADLLVDTLRRSA